MKQIGLSAAQLAQEIGGVCEGDGDIIVVKPAEPASAKVNEVALAADPKYMAQLKDGNARVAILPLGTDWKALGLDAAILVTSARKTMVEMSYALEIPWARAWGEDRIHATAIIDPTATIAKDVAIGPFTIIGPNVNIGAGTIIHDHVTIAQDVTIGANSQIYSGVRIGPEVQLGLENIIMANTVLGADGFSYLTPNQDAIKAARSSGAASALSDLAIERINSLGSVILGDRVEMGAGCTVDRGTIKNTVIGAGTKIDNMVHIAHNVQVGENCLLCAQVGIAGSTIIGDRTILGGQVGVADNITVGSDVIAAGKSAISSRVGSGQTVMGNPAIKMSLNVDSYKGYRRLPRLFTRVKDLEDKLANMLKGNGE